MISIIIVHYRIKKELFACIQSIIANNVKTAYEMIVVDNDEVPLIGKELKRKFPQVKYISGHGNVGYGEGNNIGAGVAKGDFLFFLNPDTKVLPDAIDNLVNFLEKNKKAAVVAPLLHDMKGKVYQQGALELTPLQAITSLSFIHKLFPKNPFAKRYYLSDWDQQTTKEVAVAPGTAFMVRKKVFTKVGGFDKKYFLYFEEFDLCKRIRNLKWKIYILPTAKILHEWGGSTKQITNTSQIFNKSRFYYFKKHFGLFNALWTEFFLRIGKYNVFLLAILAIAAFLRLIHVGASMIFIGDQGWFYLSARDMLLTGNIPLVGIASSHPWLHQGAFWTYLLAGSLGVFHFNPLSGVYLGTFLDIMSILLLYKFATVFFSQRTGILAAAFYAVSPLVIANIRMPYHTSPIPLFTMVFLFVFYQWIHKGKYYFPLVIFSLAFLYNLEIATFSLSIFVGSTLLYGLIKKRTWATTIFNPKVFFLSLFCFLLPMSPMIIYDFSHGFPQTVKFLTWIGYKLLITIGFFPAHESHTVSLQNIMSFVMDKYRLLVYPFNGLISFVIFVGSIFYIILQSLKRQKNALVLLLLNIFLIAGFFLAKTSSDAYLPVMFPGLILVIAYFFNGLLINKNTKNITLPFFIAIILFNCFYMFFSIYVTLNNNFIKQITIARKIVNDAQKKDYSIRGVGEGSQFSSFTMNYEYLTWWLGNAPSKKMEPLLYIIDGEHVRVMNKQLKQ